MENNLEAKGRAGGSTDGPPGGLKTQASIGILFSLKVFSVLIQYQVFVLY